MLTFLRPGGLACCCSAPFVSAVNSTDGSSALTCHNRKRTSAFWFCRSAIVSVKSPVFTHWLSNLLAVVLSLCQDEIWGFFFFFLIGSDCQLTYIHAEFKLHQFMSYRMWWRTCSEGSDAMFAWSEISQVFFSTFFFLQFVLWKQQTALLHAVCSIYWVVASIIYRGFFYFMVAPKLHLMHNSPPCFIFKLPK